MAGSIVTRTGDEGTTGLLYGQRVPKDHPQIEAVGAFDELNVALGAIKPLLVDPDLRAFITGLQHNLVALMGELACAESDRVRYADSNFSKITGADVTKLDEAVGVLEARGLNLTAGPRRVRPPLARPSIPPGSPPDGPDAGSTPFRPTAASCARN